MALYLPFRPFNHSAISAIPPLPLDLDYPTMQRLGRRVADLVARHLATLREQPTRRTLSRAEADRMIAGPAPRSGTDFETLLAKLERDVIPYHTREPHPGFVAYVQSCSAFPAVLGDWIATGYNFFGGAWVVAPGPTTLELTVLDWFREWLGMPKGAGGLLTSGGSTATLTAVVAARHAMCDDPARLAKAVLYTSDQAHSSVTRAAWIAGLPRDHIRAVPVDGEWRMKPDELQKAITQDRNAGLLPVAVVASAGTTNTGAVDPLVAIADLCKREGLWFHVDAAYGGFTVLTDHGRRMLDGIGLADSITLDPHKWLFVPFECGCLMVKDPARLRQAFHILPEYLEALDTAAEEVNFADLGEQLSRYSRAFKVWLCVQYYGTEALGGAIEQGIRNAEIAEELIRQAPELEILSPARLGILCFRARGTGDAATLDALNHRILQRVNDNARYFISTTRLNGALALRICTPGFRTTPDDIKGLVQEIRDVVAELREK